MYNEFHLICQVIMNNIHHIFRISFFMCLGMAFVHPNWMRLRAVKCPSTQRQYERRSCCVVSSARWFWFSTPSINHCLCLFLSIYCTSSLYTFLSLFAGMRRMQSVKNERRQKRCQTICSAGDSSVSDSEHPRPWQKGNWGRLVRCWRIMITILRRKRSI